MLRALLLLAVLFLQRPEMASGQQTLAIEGPQDAIGYNSIAEVSTNVEIVEDEEGLPSHTIEWTVPRDMRERVKFYYDGSLVAVPTGCYDHDILVEVRVTDWIRRRIEKEEITIRVRKAPGDPDPEEPPPDNIPPDDTDYTSSPLYQITMNSYAAVDDVEKVKWANHMRANFTFIANEIRDGRYEDVETMLNDVRLANRGELNNTTIWPEASRAKWVAFRTALAAAFDALESAGELKVVEDYEFHWRAVALGLKMAAGGE